MLRQFADAFFPILRLVLDALIVVLFFQFGRLWEQRIRRTGVRTKKTSSCPVENCNIQGPHSHIGDLMRRIREK